MLRLWRKKTWKRQRRSWVGSPILAEPHFGGDQTWCKSMVILRDFFMIAHCCIFSRWWFHSYVLGVFTPIFWVKPWSNLTVAYFSDGWELNQPEALVMKACFWALKGQRRTLKNIYVYIYIIAHRSKIRSIRCFGSEMVPKTLCRHDMLMFLNRV